MNHQQNERRSKKNKLTGSDGIVPVTIMNNNEIQPKQNINHPAAISENDQIDEIDEPQEGFVKTTALNYVSRQSYIHGAQNVEMKGKSIIYPHAHIRGDITNIRIGRYCTIGYHTIIRPPSYQSSLTKINNSSKSNDQKIVQFLPSLIGSHTRIGNNCVIEAASIGSCVFIADNVVVSKRVIIKDCCYIEEGTVIPDDTVIPPFSRVGGCPGKILNDDCGDPYLVVPESVAVIFVNDCIRRFGEFVDQLDGE